MTHAKAMAIAVAYDMCLECCTGKLRADCKVEKAVDFHRFREKLAVQMLNYNPQKRLHPGDENFRVCTQQNKKQRMRTTSPPRPQQLVSTAAGINASDLDNPSSALRLCGFVDKLIEHQKSIVAMPNKSSRVCAFCGLRTTHMCTKCDKPLHAHPLEDFDKHVTCFLLCHNTGHFGLARSDWRIVDGVRQKDWTCPTEQELKRNSKQMKQIHAQATTASTSTAAASLNDSTTDSSNSKNSDMV